MERRWGLSMTTLATPFTSSKVWDTRVLHLWQCIPCTSKIQTCVVAWAWTDCSGSGWPESGVSPRVRMMWRCESWCAHGEAGSRLEAGSSVVTETRQGLPPSAWPFAACLAAAAGGALAHRQVIFWVRRRSALVMTLTLERAIAAAAMIGERSSPKMG